MWDRYTQFQFTAHYYPLTVEYIIYYYIVRGEWVNEEEILDASQEKSN